MWENGLVWHITENSNSKSQHVNFKKRFCFISNYLSLLLFSTLAPDEIPKACRYKGKDGKTQEPQWRDGGSGATYYPSHNISPQSFTWVSMYSRVVCILPFICWLGALQKFHGSEMLGMFAVKRKFVVWHGEKKWKMEVHSISLLSINTFKRNTSSNPPRYLALSSFSWTHTWLRCTILSSGKQYVIPHFKSLVKRYKCAYNFLFSFIFILSLLFDRQSRPVSWKISFWKQKLNY